MTSFRAFAVWVGSLVILFLVAGPQRLEAQGSSVEQAYQTLMTGLAVRYFNAVAGSS